VSTIRSSRVVAFLQAVARPKFRGPRSASIALSPVCLSLPVGRFQLGGTCPIHASNTVCLHSSRVVAFLQAVVRPKFRGPRSASIALSQVWLSLPVGRFQLGGTCPIHASNTVCLHSSRVVAFLQAVARPRFRGPRSASIARSQVWSSCYIMCNIRYDTIVRV